MTVFLIETELSKYSTEDLSFSEIQAAGLERIRSSTQNTLS